MAEHRSQADSDPWGGLSSTHGGVARDARHDQLEPPDGLERIWAPWRFGYVAGGAPIQGCPFCVLPARDPGEDRASLILQRGDHAYVVLNAYPYNPGHVMVIPYAHVADLEDVSDDALGDVWTLARRAVVVLKQRLGCQGVNLGANLGSAAGAGIAPHLHIHVVPRWAGDTNFMSVVGAARVLPRALQEIYDELAPGFA